VTPTVLVGFAEAMSAPEVVWSLARRGYKVAAFARAGKRSALRHSRYTTCDELVPPDLDVGEALSGLTQLCRKHLQNGPVVLFPLDDSAVWLASHVASLPGLMLAGPPPDLAEVALDKEKQLVLARKAGFRVPATSFCTSVEQLRRAAGSFPLIIKPASAARESGGRLIKGRSWICDNAKELGSAIAQWAGHWPVLVQPFVSGTGEGVFGIAHDGGVSAWSGHRRLRMMNPHGSGSSACVSQPVPEDLRSTALRFVREAQWVGLFMIEMLRDNAGDLWFIEFNGRPWGSIALSCRQGFEYPAWNVDLALEPRSIPIPNEQTNGSLVCRNLGREFMHLLFVLRGPKSTALRDWPSFWKAFSAVVTFRRTDAIYNWYSRDPGVVITDCYFTIRDNLFKTRRPR
jgi:predicted ATP-grasp superfamily ATP-dependent carboligase